MIECIAHGALKILQNSASINGKQCLFKIQQQLLFLLWSKMTTGTVIVARKIFMHPSIWGDYISSFMLANVNFLELKEEIKRMLMAADVKPVQKLFLIDAKNTHKPQCLWSLIGDNDDGLHSISLQFRLFRQPQDVVLDEDLAFTASHLESMVPHVTPQLAEQIIRSLNRPIRRNLPRLEAKYYIDIYSGNDSKIQTLLKFAKLDFNMLQVQHQKELSSITEWWKNVDVKAKFPYARDRLVECYFWTMGVYFEPQYSFPRRILTKVTAMASILDDTYDAYGTYEELELFTDAIQRWDINTIYVLKGRSYWVHYSIQEMKKLVKAYCVEAKWCNESYVPTMEEYMDISLVTTCYPMLAITSFLGMGKIANRDVLEWSSNDNYPKIIKASTIICRLMDDIVSHEFEQKRQHVVSSIECYMKQDAGVSEEEVIKMFRKEIFNAWKDINQEFLKPTAAAAPMPILTRILNLSRVMDVIYKDDDGYTNSHVIKHYIDSLLLNSFPL
ncbi:hypothetical protein ACOSP7_030595 [Xanthoceras sorbifolium]